MLLLYWYSNLTVGMDFILIVIQCMHAGMGAVGLNGSSPSINLPLK